MLQGMNFRVAHLGWLGAVVALAMTPTGARALSIDGRATALETAGARRVTGRVTSVVSARGADGVLRTDVTLAGPDGATAATFTTPGGREGGVIWVADGVPAFEVGETVGVVLVESGGRTVVADDPAAVTRLAPAPSGASGERWSQAFDAPPSTITEVTPPLGGAAPGSGVLVSVRGTGFGATQGNSRVTFQGLFERVDAPVSSWSDTEIRCFVPVPGVRGEPQVLSGPIKVWTEAGGWSDGDEFVGGPRFRVTYQWAGDAYPYERLPVPVYLNPEGFPFGAAGGEIVKEALAAWDTPGSYGHLVYRGLTNADAGNHGDDLTRRDGRNTVRWRTTWPHNPAWIAVTWSAIDTLTLERLETDLEFNGLKRWTIDPEADPEAFDLPSTLVHEFGHWLRLGHTQSVASAMVGFQVPGVRRRTISPADRFGTSFIYPSYGAVEAPAAAAPGAAIALRVLALDREGNPRPSVPADRVTVRVVPLVRDAAGVLGPSPLSPTISSGAPQAQATTATDPDGWTDLALAGLAEGSYRLEVQIDGQLVRPTPVLVVGTPPPPAAPVLSFAGVTPSPLRAGVRGVVRFTLPASAHVRLDLYDPRGRKVREVANERLAAGPNEVVLWTSDAQGHALGAGVYFLRLASVAGATFEPRVARVVVLP
jgi:hypothetical protein